MALVWGLVTRLSTLAGPAVMLVYPLYASIKAIESPFKEDDQQWLTYWVLYSLVALLELSLSALFEWIPLWSTIKLALAAWLVLPQFQGGTLVYERYVRPVFYKVQPYVDQRLSEGHWKALQMMSPDSRASLAQFIHENGHDAFSNMISAANSAASRSRPSY